jgi:hypothetical protein
MDDMATLHRTARSWSDDHADPRPLADADLIGVTIVDLDRTITRRGTYSPFLIHAALRRAPWRLLLVPVVIAFMVGYRLGWIERKALKQRMHALLLGRAVPRGRRAAG